ncbi:MAG: translation initiation factor eIF-1A [Candidatus Aenigmatarchaeota archaeon]
MYVREKPTEEEEIARTRIPKEGELLGVVIEMLGASRLRVECGDGLTRICRIPGSMRKKLWVRNGDLVMVTPWKVQSHERADIEWKYTRAQANWLKKKGYLGNLNYG